MSSTVDDKEMLIFVEEFEFGAFVNFANSIPEVILKGHYINTEQ
jgi:hypothetical protein